MKDSSKPTLTKCSHKFERKMVNGLMCSNCGTAITHKSSTVGLKSNNFNTKVHFNVTGVDNLFDNERDTYRLTNNPYIKIRNSLVAFLFEKGNLLKLSKKSIHTASSIMDIYFESKGSAIPANDNTLVAACCLLVGAKAVELDDRIPFISKLKKYTSVYGSREQFKDYEVNIAETLQWDLQVLTFYDYVQYFLCKGVISEEDKVFNKLLNSSGFAENLKASEIISKISSKSEGGENHPYPGLKDKYGGYKKDSKTEDSCVLIKNFNKVNLKDNGITEMKFLNPTVKESTLLFFENYVELICETLQKNYSIWNYDKKKLAVCVILFARSSIFNGANTWNLRLEELTEMHLSQIRDCFSSICQFFSYSSKNPTGTPQHPSHNLPSSTSPNPLKPINLNSNISSLSTTPDNSQNSSGYYNEKSTNPNKSGNTTSTANSSTAQNPHKTPTAGQNMFTYQNQNSQVQGNGHYSGRWMENGASSMNKTLCRLNSYTSQCELKKKNSSTSVNELLGRGKTDNYH